MDIRKRLKTIQIIEKVHRNNEYAKKIGIQDISKFEPENRITAREEK